VPDFTLYLSHTVWQSKAAFEAWTRSEEFRAAHKDAGQNKPLYIDHPQLLRGAPDCASGRGCGRLAPVGDAELPSVRWASS